jgi:ribokinase
MAAKRTVAIIGSLNIDFVTRTKRLPEGGETLAATSFDTGFGGKGANQAVAAARLAGPDVTVQMVGNVGDDSFGRDYVEALAKEGIDTKGVRQLSDGKTGVTNIIVEEETGENRILFVANANFDAFEKQQSAAWDLLPAQCDVAVFQLEIPVDVVCSWSMFNFGRALLEAERLSGLDSDGMLPQVLHNLHQAQERGIHTILNPAPAELLPDFVYQDIDTLIMNETESSILSGHPKTLDQPDDDAIIIVARQFLHWGVKEAVIVTLGERGLIYATVSGRQGYIPARKVTVVDTTAAGDTFAGAYAVERAKASAGEFDIEKALTFATLAASKAVGKAGAMTSIPRLKELQV